MPDILPLYHGHRRGAMEHVRALAEACDKPKWVGVTLEDPPLAFEGAVSSKSRAFAMRVTALRSPAHSEQLNEQEFVANVRALMDDFGLGNLWQITYRHTAFFYRAEILPVGVTLNRKKA